MRGKPGRYLLLCAGVGSIPACAGEARPLRRKPHCWRVYPRVCGGSQRPIEKDWGNDGLSPRVRGKLSKSHPFFASPRSIPACAGEAKKHIVLSSSGAVYPRVCGGSAVADTVTPLGNGLSPRVRGKLVGPGPGPRLHRSIPACAGEAGRPWPWPASASVYPRVCGGSRRRAGLGWGGPGLSPRVRGKHALAPKGAQPDVVYPRVCGGSP